jgi:enoyl-CoA hydratase/carnithine racemase
MPTMQEDMPATMVRYETEDKVGIITLDRADKLNAINSVMKDEIIAAFARADKEPATSVIVLQANGRSFSAGFDLGHSPDRGKDSSAPPIPIRGIRCCIAASILEWRRGRRGNR